MGNTKEDKPVICLQDIIAGYVWKRYLHFLGRPKRYLAKKGKHTIDIEWDNLTLEHNSKILVHHNTDNNVMDSINFSASSLSFKSDKHSESYVSADSDVGAPYVLCSRAFENQLRKRRQFKLYTQKETPVSVNVRFHEYFTLNKATSIRVDLPVNTIPGDNSQHSLLVTDAANQRFSNNCQWIVNTGVIVKGCHKVKVSCVVYEQEKTADVVVSTKLSSDTGFFSVHVRRDSDQKVVYTCIITNLAEVFRTHTGPNLSVVTSTDDSNHRSSHIVLTSRGMCKVNGYSDQHVVVRSERVLEYTV